MFDLFLIKYLATHNFLLYTGFIVGSKQCESTTVVSSASQVEFRPKQQCFGLFFALLGTQLAIPNHSLTVSL